MSFLLGWKAGAAFIDVITYSSCTKTSNNVRRPIQVPTRLKHLKIDQRQQYSHLALQIPFPMSLPLLSPNLLVLFMMALSEPDVGNISLDVVDNNML